MRNIYLIILGLFIYISILLNLVNAYTLTGCGTINSSGEYYLTGNISYSGSCLLINSSNVIIDGSGYGIYGDGTGIGIEISNGMWNITLKNITVSNFSTSVLFNNVTLYIYDSHIDSVKSRQNTVDINAKALYNLHIENSDIGMLTNYDTSYCFNNFEILIVNSTVNEILANGDHNFRLMNMTVINSTINIIKTTGSTTNGYNFQSCGFSDVNSVYGRIPVMFINSTIYGMESNTPNDFEYECHFLFENSNIYGNIVANSNYFFLRSILELRNSYMNGSFIANGYSPFYSEGNDKRYLLINNSVIESSVAFDIHNTYTTHPDRGASIYIVNSVIKTTGTNYADLYRIKIYNTTLSGKYFYFKHGSKSELYNVTFNVVDDIVFDSLSQTILRNITVDCYSGNCLFFNTTSTSIDKNSIACSLYSNGSVYISDRFPFVSEFYQSDCSGFSCGYSYENLAQDINLTQDGFILGYFDKTPCVYIGSGVSGNVNIYGKVFVGFSNNFVNINNSVTTTYYINLNDSGTYPVIRIYSPSKISATSFGNILDVDVYSGSIKVDIFDSKLHKLYSSNSGYAQYNDVNITNSIITTIDGYLKYIDINITNSTVANLQPSVNYGFYSSTIRINKSIITTIKPLADYVFSRSNMYVYNSTIDTFDTTIKTQPFYYGHVYFYDNSCIKNIYIGSGIASFYNGLMEIDNSIVNYIFFDAYSNGLSKFTLKIDNSNIIGTQQYCLYEESISSSHTISIYNTNISNCPSGLYFTGTATVNFINNTIYNVSNAITFSSTKSSTIYNNMFNVSNSFITFTGTINTHVFNTTKTVGTNIVGGPYIGGNYWGCTNISCFSDICSDLDKDGICDSIFSLSDTNKDYLPLAIYIPNLPPQINDVRLKIIYEGQLPNVSMYVNATDPEGDLDYLEYLGSVTNTSVNGWFEFIIGHKSNISGLLKVNDTYGNSVSKNVSLILVNNSYVPKTDYEATVYSQVLIKNDTLKNIGEMPFDYEVIHDNLGGTFTQGGTFTGTLNPGETAVLYSEIQGDWISESVSETKNNNVLTISEVLTSEFNFTNVTTLIDVDDFIKNGNLFVLYGPTWYLITPNTSCDVGFTNYTIEGDLWRTCYVDNDNDGVEDIYKVIIPHFSTVQLRAVGETATHSVSGGGGGGGGGGVSGFIIYSPDTEIYYNKTQTEEIIQKSIEEGKPVFTLKIRLDRKSKISVYLVDNNTLMFSGNTSFVSLMLPTGRYKVVVEKDGIKKEIIVELNQPKTLDIRLDELNQETVHQTQADVSFKIGRVLIVIIVILVVILFFRYR